MRTRDNRIHPALKHGAYAATAVLPGESRAAFEKLHRDLIAELAPNGVLEEDTVASIARLLWRKQNLGTLRITERARNRSWPIERVNEKLTRAMLQENYDEYEKEKRAAEDRARKEFGNAYELVEIGDAATFDGLAKDLAFQKSLDDMIDRNLKRLLFLRGLKSISTTAPSTAPPQRVSGPSRAA
jgi:hypothetical protein